MKRSSDEWEKLITEAYESAIPVARWCREHNVPRRSFRAARDRLLNKGKLESLTERISFPLSKENRRYVRLPMNNCQAFLVLKPIRSNLSMQSMASIIWFELNLSLIPGQYFFFISKNKKEIFALKVCKNGYCLLNRKLEYGFFSWPEYDGSDTQFLYRYEYNRIIKTLEI